jgi:hypothetical protein
MSTPPWPPPPGGLQPMPGPATGNSNATLILVLGILSIVCLPIVGPVAWILGNNALSSGTVDPSQISQVNAGRICGMVGTAFLALGIIYWIAIAVGVAHGLGTPHPTPMSSPSTP